MFKPPDELIHDYVYTPLMGCGPFSPEDNAIFKGSWDFVRHGAMGLAAKRILSENIPGDFAELGVWRGDCAEIIHHFAPERKMYLFDTFTGFPEQKDADDNKYVTEFLNTSEQLVRERFKDDSNVIVKAGIFPETTKGLEDNTFAFVSLDCDLYEPILAGWEFFYPRLSPGGYIFVHDHNSPGYNAGPLRATREFLSDKPEVVIDIPDQWASIMVRKIGPTLNQGLDRRARDAGFIPRLARKASSALRRLS